MSCTVCHDLCTPEFVVAMVCIIIDMCVHEFEPARVSV